MNRHTLKQENRAFTGTAGVSPNNARAGFVPAFRDEATGRVEFARMADGSCAPMHIITFLPLEWALVCDTGGGIIELKPGIVSGFCRDGEFFTREEAAAQLS